MANRLYKFTRNNLPTILTVAGAVTLCILVAPHASAQGPWTTATENMAAAFKGPIAKGLGVIAVVVGGLGYAFGEGQGKKTIAAVVFGVGMAIGAVNFLGWLGLGG